VVNSVASSLYFFWFDLVAWLFGLIALGWWVCLFVVLVIGCLLFPFALRFMVWFCCGLLFWGGC